MREERPPKRRWGRAGRLVGIVGGGACLVALLAVGVFPTRTFLDQRQDSKESQERLEILREQNAALAERIDRLTTPEEIERLAREQYNLVFPGEEPYVLLPAPLPPLELPTVWPFGPMLPPDDAVESAAE